MEALRTAHEERPGEVATLWIHDYHLMEVMISSTS